MEFGAPFCLFRDTKCLKQRSAAQTSSYARDRLRNIKLHQRLRDDETC